MTNDGSLGYRSNGARNQKAEIRNKNRESRIKNQESRMVPTLVSTCIGEVSAFCFIPCVQVVKFAVGKSGMRPSPLRPSPARGEGEQKGVGTILPRALALG